MCYCLGGLWQLLLLGEGYPVEPVLTVGWFRLARLTTESYQAEKSLDLSLLVLPSCCWQSQGYGKSGGLGFNLLLRERGSALALFLWLCSVF